MVLINEIERLPEGIKYIINKFKMKVLMKLI